jgi:hypothetical protein
MWNYLALSLLVMGTPETGGVETTKVSTPHMFNSFSALAAVVLLGGLVIALPVLAPKVEASEAAAPQIKETVLSCSSQVWPDIATSCLRSNDGSKKILEARLVTARR